MLGLERLIVGRECNAFDRLSPARKSRAFAELIHHGLAYGKVEEVAGQDHPNVTLQRVSSRGRRLNRSLRAPGGSLSRGWQMFWIFLVLAAAFLGCMYLMAKATGS